MARKTTKPSPSPVQTSPRVAWGNYKITLEPLQNRKGIFINVKCFNCKRMPMAGQDRLGRFTSGRGLREWVCDQCAISVEPSPFRTAVLEHEAKLFELGIDTYDPNDKAIAALEAAKTADIATHNKAVERKARKQVTKDDVNKPMKSRKPVQKKG